MTLSESRFFVRTGNRLTIHPVVTGSLAGKVVLVLEFSPVASALVGTLCHKARHHATKGRNYIVEDSEASSRRACEWSMLCHGTYMLCDI